MKPSKTHFFVYFLSTVVGYTCIGLFFGFFFGWPSIQKPSFLHKQSLQNSQQAEHFFDSYISCNTNPVGIYSWLMSKTDMVIVDVRDEESYAEKHIPTAINIPYNAYNSFDTSETSFPQLRFDVFNYIYCYSDFCNLSHRAAKRFAQLGYPVKVIRGGFDEWQKHNYPVDNH